MTDLFNDNFLLSLLPDKYNNGTCYDVREGTGKGFSVTVFPSGEISFIFFYHFNGRKRRMTLGKYPYITINKARKMHHEALIILESGKDPALRKRLRIRDTRKNMGNKK